MPLSIPISCQCFAVSDLYSHFSLCFFHCPMPHILISRCVFFTIPCLFCTPFHLDLLPTHHCESLYSILASHSFFFFVVPCFLSCLSIPTSCQCIIMSAHILASCSVFFTIPYFLYPFPSQPLPTHYCKSSYSILLLTLFFSLSCAFCHVPPSQPLANTSL